jgi:hypothetical protein
MAKGNGKTKARRIESGTSRRRRIHLDFGDSGTLRKSVEKVEDLPEPTEQEKEVLKVMESSLVLGDDVARAAARFLRDELIPRLRENDEQPEEFDVDEFQSVCDHLMRIHVVQKMIHLFGLGEYEREILVHFIGKAFKGKPPSVPKTVFPGDDENFMDHMARTQG